MMNRLEKKYLLASAALHGLLLLILLVGPAFLASNKRPPDLPLLDVIPSKLVDAALFSGTPNAPPPPAAQAELPKPQPPEPQTKPPPERRQPVKPQLEPEVERAETPKITTRKPKIDVSREITTRTPKETADAQAKQAQEEARRRERERELTAARQRAMRQIDARLSGAVRSLSEGLSSTRVEIPGVGAVAFASYGQVVMSIYQKNWIQPAGIEATVVVKATVVIARDGRVTSARVTDHSGNAVVDKSVSEVLQRVKFVAPFPEETKDESRTFNLDFELKPSQLAG